MGQFSINIDDHDSYFTNNMNFDDERLIFFMSQFIFMSRK